MYHIYPGRERRRVTSLRIRVPAACCSLLEKANRTNPCLPVQANVFAFVHSTRIHVHTYPPLRPQKRSEIVTFLSQHATSWLINQYTNSRRIYSSVFAQCDIFKTTLLETNDDGYRLLLQRIQILT